MVGNVEDIKQQLIDLFLFQESRVNLTYAGAAGVVNLTRLPVDLREQSVVSLGCHGYHGERLIIFQKAESHYLT